jgi:hypothetical protein
MVQLPNICVGAEHDRLAVPVSPVDESISSMYVADWPAAIGWTTGCPVEVAMQKSMAVPLSGILCGLPGALSFKVSVALRAPPIVLHVGCCIGLNATCTEHVALGGVLAPVHESLTSAKSPGFAPDFATEEIVSAPANGPELLFVTTIGCGAPPAPPASWLPKLMLVGMEMPA